MARISQLSSYSELPPRPRLPTGHTINQPALRFTYLQPPTCPTLQFLILKNFCICKCTQLQVMVSDTVISILLLSSGSPFLKAWEAASSSYHITLFVPSLSQLLPPCTLTTSLPVSTSSSTSSSVAPLHGPEYFLAPQKPHIHHTSLLSAYFQSLQGVSTPLQPLTAQLGCPPAHRATRVQHYFPISAPLLGKIKFRF